MASYFSPPFFSFCGIVLKQAVIWGKKKNQPKTSKQRQREKKAVWGGTLPCVRCVFVFFFFFLSFFCFVTPPVVCPQARKQKGSRAFNEDTRKCDYDSPTKENRREKLFYLS
eukprot:TRINITY_DN1628_c0_g2_i1.p1 TRINITY_DN1628_c0_g2~~TRINITY_DN1628_c0_g2_i1.p1  ORF type:complete len:112 (+),score=1.48 TRINITY_DN1628_c0_g2_i1:148-483(+)